jgi:hypothetical protein
VRRALGHPDLLQDPEEREAQTATKRTTLALPLSDTRAKG